MNIEEYSAINEGGYVILLNESAGVKGLRNLSEVRLNLVSKTRQGFTVKKVYFNSIDITAEAVRGLPL